MPRAQTFCAAILGAWIAVTLLMWFVAAGSFSTLDRVLASPNARFAEAVKPLGPGQSRAVLRYLASEINRNCFRAYNWAQIALGGLLVVLLSRQSPRDTTAIVVALAMFCLVLALAFVVTPQIVSLGRDLDFVPRDPVPPGMARFRMLHAAFTGLDGVKLLAGLALVVRWAISR